MGAAWRDEEMEEGREQKWVTEGGEGEETEKQRNGGVKIKSIDWKTTPREQGWDTGRGKALYNTALTGKRSSQ